MPFETGTAKSGDVEIFYRRFGPGDDAGAGAPWLILHGAGYYDSADWIAVGSALAAASGREVVAYDARGYGRSGWSASRDYSMDAQMADVTAVLDGLGWQRAGLLGHSRGGAFALRYVTARPERVDAVIFADACPGRTARGPAPASPGSAPAGLASAPAGPAPARSASAGPAPAGRAPSETWADPVYGTLAAALASTSRDPRSLEDPVKRARLEDIFTSVPGGYRLALRDPAFQSRGGGGGFDGWAALGAIGVPTLFIRALRSQSFDDAAWERAHAVLPGAGFVELQAGHDLANEAPDPTVTAIRRFLASPAG